MEQISVLEAKDIIEEKIGKDDFELLDVRNPLEYKEAHIQGSKLIPLNELEAHMPKLDKNKEYLVYCKSGGRSAMACQFLIDFKFKAINVKGGITDWIEQGFEIEKN